MMRPAMGNTLQLIIPGIIISLVLSPSALGVYSAVKQYSVGDYLFTGLSFLGISMPPFWFGLIAIEFLAFQPKTVVRPAEHAARLRRPAHAGPDRRATSTTCST